MARPLNESLTAAYADLTREFALASGELGDVLQLGVYANVLRLLPDEGLDPREIPRLAAVSKRAAKWDVGIAKRRGWVVDGQRDGVVRLSDAGTEAVKQFERSFSSAEAAWRKRFGTDVVERLRTALSALVRQFDLELPHHPTGYGPADGSVTGGVSGRWGRRHALRVKGLPGGVFDPVAEYEAAEAWEKDSGGRLYVRDTGQDWRPVERRDTDVDRLSLFALLSQAIMAFAIDYEGCGGLAMARSGNVLRAFGDDGVEIALRQARSGGATVMLPHDGTYAALERHAYASLVVDPKDSRVGRLTLTAKGEAVRDAYDEIVVAIEGRWKRRYGAGAVRDLRRALVFASARS